MNVATTFTKFDALGSCLAELSFDAVSIGMSRREDGTLMYSVYLHQNGECTQGIGDTPTDALSDALAMLAKRSVAKVEAAAELAA